MDLKLPWFSRQPQNHLRARLLRIRASQLKGCECSRGSDCSRSIDAVCQLDIERPGTKVLYISGFADSVASESIGRGQPNAVLMKPFTGRQLLARVQEILGPI